MTEIKNFDGDISVGRHAVVGGDAKVCGGMKVGKNLKVEGWLDAKNLKAANKGVFLNEESLKKAYPVPKDGWWALVGDTLPAALWVAADGEWANTGGTGGDILLESEVLADIKERLARAQAEVFINTEKLDVQERYVAALNAASSEHSQKIEAIEGRSVEIEAKNAEQDSRLANAEGLNTKQNERLLNYVYPKLYQLNEGAGARAFDGFTEESGALKLLLTKDTYQYRVLYSTEQKQFVLRVIDTANFANPTVGTFAIWDKIDLPNGSSIASSPSYAQRDRLYYIFEPNEGSTYYYIDSNGKATEQSATYLLRRLVDKNTSAIAALQGNVVGPGGDNSDYGEQIKELGEFDTLAVLIARAARFDIVSNNAIALLHGTYKQADGIYNGVIILQQVDKNIDGGGTAMQYIYFRNQQFTSSITFSATNVTSIQPPQYHGARNLSLSERVLQMTNIEGQKVGDSVTLPDKGNIYEGEAGASSVPVVLAKTFGGTVNATLGAATSARAGVMTVDHVNKIKKLEERVLQYLYPKLYQLNEGAGALPFDGEYSGSASVLDGRKTAAEDGCTYKVVFASRKFLLLEINQDGEDAGLYQEWDKIISGRGSSEDYTRRDRLYYVYTEGEGSYYYYVDADGNISEQAGTYLLRRLIDETKAKIASVEGTANSAQSTASAAQTKNTEQDARLDNIEARIDPDIAGRVWNEDNGTYRAESYYGSVKALRDLPKRLGLGRYLVSDERQKTKLHPNDSHKYLDGTPAALDGTEGQCMWCWEGFYANIWHEGSRLIKAVTFDGPVGDDISIWIPAGGISWLGAGVMDRGEAPYTDKTKWKLCSVINNSEQFRGGGGNALDASKFTKAPADTTPQITMLGMPATNISTTDFGTYARKRGDGWEANWFVARFVVEFLFEVIMGTENSQEAFNANKDANGLYQGGFGTGVTDMPEWSNYNGSYPVIPTSVGLEASDGVCLVEYKLPQTNGVDGDTYKTFNVPVFFGLVGAGYGIGNEWVRGLIIDVGKEQSLVYVAPRMADYDPNTVADKILVAECSRVSGWIKRKSYRGLCCMPTVTGGSHNIRYSDHFFTDLSKGLRVRMAGGSPDGGAFAGESNTYIHNTDGFVSTGTSSPLCYFTEDPIIPDSQSIENNN